MNLFCLDPAKHFVLDIRFRGRKVGLWRASDRTQQQGADDGWNQMPLCHCGTRAKSFEYHFLRHHLNVPAEQIQIAPEAIALLGG